MLPNIYGFEKYVCSGAPWRSTHCIETIKLFDFPRSEPLHNDSIITWFVTCLVLENSIPADLFLLCFSDASF